MSSAATWMDLEITILSEVSKRKDKYESLKNDRNEFIYKTEIDPQTQKTNIVVKGKKEKG